MFFDSHTSEYLLRSYNKQELFNKMNSSIILHENDIQFINAIKKMKELYNQYDNRRSIIVLTPDDINKLQTIKEKSIKKPLVDVSICTALKKNGDKCNCKAQPGSSFCGRHKKK